MVYKNKREERYRKTEKGRLAHNRSCSNYANKLRKTDEGRLTLRLRKVKPEHHLWYKKQKSKCRICGKKLDKSPLHTTNKQNQAVIDHDHSRGNLRGLLCHQCNVGLGNYKDSVYLLSRAIFYILWSRVIW